MADIFTFEQTPWELCLAHLHRGDCLSAVRFLTLLENADEEETENAFMDLEEKGISLDITGLPVEPGVGETALRLRLEQQLAESGKLPEGLEETDPLRLYLEEIESLPAVDIGSLAERCAKGDEGVHAYLVNGMLPQVAAKARAMTGKGVLLLDLMQEGSLGLWQGILCYTGGDFYAHCDWWIDLYMAKTVVMQAKTQGIGQKLREKAEEYAQADHRLLTQLGRNPTLEEIAQDLQISPEMAMVLEGTVRSARMAAEVENQRKEKEPQPEDQQAVEDTAYFRIRQRIMELLSGLEELDAKLLTYRYGLEGGLPMSPAQTGEKLGLTAEEVVKREALALAQLRNDI